LKSRESKLAKAVVALVRLGREGVRGEESKSKGGAISSVFLVKSKERGGRKREERNR
jgi:hypothetical protein